MLPRSPAVVRTLYPIPHLFVALFSERSRQKKTKKKSPSSSEPPQKSASTAADAAAADADAIKAKKVIHPERRFAGYKLADINQPLRRGGGSRGGGWGRTGRGKDWLQDYLNEPRRPELEVMDSATERGETYFTSGFADWNDRDLRQPGHLFCCCRGQCRCRKTWVRDSVGKLISHAVEQNKSFGHIC